MSSLNVSGAFVYFVIPILGGIPITQTTVSSLIVTIILIALSIRLGKNLQKRPTGVQVLVEKGVSMLYGMVAETMGEHNLYWAPFIGTIFLSSILGQLDWHDWLPAFNDCGFELYVGLGGSCIAADLV